MRKSNTFGILMIGIGAIGLFYALTSSDEKRDNWFGLKGKEVQIEKTAYVDQISQLIIDVGSANVELVKGGEADNQLRATLSGYAGIGNSAVDLTLEDTGDALELGIDHQSPKWGLGLAFGQLELVVEVPEKSWETIDVKTGSGNITMAGASATNAAIKTGSGNIDLSGAESANVEIKAGSGNIGLADIQADRVEIRVGSGNITAESYTAGELDLQAGSGNVKLIGGSAEIVGKVDSGNIRIEADELHNGADLRTGSGNVKVITAKQPDNLTVDFSGGSGNGTVEWDGFVSETGSRNEDAVRGAFGNGEHLLKVRTGSGNFDLLRQ